MQRDAFKHELDHLVKIGVLEHSGASQWASGTFIIPKKDGCIQWISDFRALNKCIKRKTYPLPHISKILSKRTGYAYFSKLDISMAYYTFELDDESKDLCTINTPYGLYRYRVLPLGIAQSPDFCQETMEHTLQGIMDADVYINDIGCFGKSWEQHLQVLEQVMIRLQDNGFSETHANVNGLCRRLIFWATGLHQTGSSPGARRLTQSYGCNVHALSKTFTLSLALLPTTTLCFRNVLTSLLRLLLLPLRSLGMLLVC